MQSDCGLSLDVVENSSNRTVPVIGLASNWRHNLDDLATSPMQTCQAPCVLQHTLGIRRANERCDNGAIAAQIKVIPVTFWVFQSYLHNSSILVMLPPHDQNRA